MDFFIGSVHHVHEIPIDYDKAFFARAVEAAGGSEERLYEDYFDSQLEMLQALTPVVVGHFDLIRLLSEEPNRDLKAWKKGVWERIVRNLKVVVEQGGLLEINSAALRKGLKEPYPARSICEVCLNWVSFSYMNEFSPFCPPYYFFSLFTTLVRCAHQFFGDILGVLENGWEVDAF